MALITAISLMTLSFLIYIIARNISHILADAYLFVLFIFSFVVSNREFSAFYLLLFIIAIVVDLSVAQFQIQPAKSAFGFEGFGLTLASLVVGLGLYIFITFISTQVGGNIVGAPELTISSTSTIAQNMRPTFVSHLGIIENRIAFAFFEVLALYGVLIPFIGVAFSLIPYVVPVVVVGLIMGLFHIAAYSVAVSLLIWASLAFMMFIVTYLLMNRDSLASDTGHLLNNGIIDINRGLAIVV